MTTLAEKGNLWVPVEYMSDDKKKKIHRNNMIFGAIALTLITVLVFLIRNDIINYFDENYYSIADHELTRHYGGFSTSHSIILMALAAAAATFIGLATGIRSGILVIMATTGVVIFVVVNFVIAGFSMKNVEGRHDINNWFKQETGYSKNIENAFANTETGGDPDNIAVTTKNEKTFIVERERTDDKDVYSVKEMEPKK